MATSRTGKDACDLLEADHRALKKLFKDYEILRTSRARGTAQKKSDLARQICQQLNVHAQIEEELFYPALRRAMKETDLLEEAEVEHQVLKELVTQIQEGLAGLQGPDAAIDARVRVLGEYLDHHVKEERTELFAKARAARKLDLQALRLQLEDRREALLDRLPAGTPAAEIAG
jgi:hemerythrin-like domain-containing protein